ncbi:hypothetical protein A6R68_07742, partial [Neotoma lepida]
VLCIELPGVHREQTVGPNLEQPGEPVPSTSILENDIVNVTSIYRYKQVGMKIKCTNNNQQQADNGAQKPQAPPQQCASRLYPKNLSSSRDMANNQLPRHRLLPFLVSHNNWLLNHHRITRRALILHKLNTTQTSQPANYTVLPALTLNLEWLQANLVLTNQDQVLFHFL